MIFNVVTRFQQQSWRILRTCEIIMALVNLRPIGRSSNRHVRFWTTGKGRHLVTLHPPVGDRREVSLPAVLVFRQLQNFDWAGSPRSHHLLRLGVAGRKPDDADGDLDARY